LLGPLEIVAEGRGLPLRAAKQKTILALLLLHRGEVVSVDQLQEALWGERPPATAPTALQGYVSQLRRVLESGEKGGSSLLVTRSPGYSLSASPEQVDLACFERLAASGREAFAAGESGRAAAVLTEALGLWRGPPLADFSYDAWAQAAIARLEEQRLAALEDRIEADLACGRHAELVGELETLVSEQPLRERPRGQLMLALYRAGRQADALATYQNARSALVDELGLEPSAELRELNKQILNQDPILAAPPATAPSPQVILPSPATPLVGRERELSELEALLGHDVRLVTLTGAGGIGKTRLAVAAASRMASRFDDGVVWVPLESLRDSALVLPTIGAALRVREDLEAHLSRRRMLLVLDNLEQVLDVAPALAAFLAACPHLSLLATSREPLRVHDEHEYPVAPLREDDAVALFVERAHAERSVAAVNGEVVEICRRLDCLPLAVELAASRTKVLSPREILSRLERRLQLLTGGARDAPLRQQTLRATIEWSHELLSREERQLFARMSLFAGGCALDAAEAVVGADLDTLQSLVDRSLLQHHGERFSMLETIREYALERLEAFGPEQELRRRHATWFAALAKDGDEVLRLGGEQQTWSERLEADHDNLRSALQWLHGSGDADEELRLAVALTRFWETHGYAAEGLAHLEHALARPSEPALHAKGLGNAGLLAHEHGDVDKARRMYEEALAVSRATDQTYEVARMLLNLGALAGDEGDVERCRAFLDESLVLFRELDDARGIRNALVNLGTLAIANGDLKRSEDLLEEALRRRREADDAAGIASCLMVLSLARLKQGRIDDARAGAKEALELSGSLGLKYVAAANLVVLAAIESEHGLAARAARLLAAAEAALEKAGTHLRGLDRELAEAIRAGLCSQLDSETIETALAEGRAMSLADASQYALDSGS